MPSKPAKVKHSVRLVLGTEDVLAKEEIYVSNTRVDEAKSEAWGMIGIRLVSILPST